MIIQKYFLFFIMYLFLFPALNAISTESQNRPTIEIITKNPSPKVGEPLIVEVKHIFNAPQFIEGTDEIQQVRSSDVGTSFYIKNNKGEVSVFSAFIDYQCRDTKGLVYSSYIILFYNPEKNKLLFDEPGKYTITPFAEQDKLKEMFGDKAPNPLIVDVKSASEMEKKALSILTGKDDLINLIRSDYITLQKEILDRFKKVVELCPDTMIGKMAAARIGIELNNEYAKQRSQLNMEDWDKLIPLKEEAIKYLQIGKQLPDAFQIRELVLYELVKNELKIEDKDYEQIISYYEEMVNKYPQGQFSETAKNGIERVKIKMANDPNWINRVQVKETEKEQSPKKPLGVALPITGAAVAVIAIAGLVFFSRKKKLKKTE